MKSKLGRLSVLAVALTCILGVGGAASDNGSLFPMRDNGGGHWFEHVCALPGATAAGCGAQVVSNESGSPLAGSTPPSGAYGPVQFHTAYNLPYSSAAGKPQTIAIVDAYDDPNAESDLATYDTQYGLPPCTTANGCFRKVNQTGGTSYPSTNSGWDLEIALDVETAHEICTNCKILLVEATTSSLANLGAAENEAAALGATEISNSWSASEYSSELQDETSYFNHPGIAITFATGDDGYASGVGFPAASQYVTAVGGTTLNLTSGNGWSSESVWSGTGSGCSKYEPKPVWQTDTGCGKRTIADVSADADPNTGAAVYDSVPYSGSSGWFQVGGTSLATPLIAGVYALAGNSGVNYGQTPYLDPGALHDITSGSNGTCTPSYLCTAGSGFDGPTGLGTPNGLGAFTSAPSPTFSLAATPISQSIAAGAGTTFSVSLNALDGFSGSASLSVSGLPSGASANSPTVSSGSPATIAITTSSSVAGGTYALTISGTSGSLVGTTSASLTIQAPKATPSLSTQASAGVGLGGSVKDTATLAGGTSPTGTITFRLYGPSDTTCSSTPVATSTATVNGNGSYSSGSYTPTQLGTYQWIASYSGDANNNAVAGTCGTTGESVTVTKGAPTLSTQASAGVKLGKAVNDVATLSGGSSPTGTITFSLYGPGNSSCSSPAAFSSTVTVKGAGRYSSASFTPKSTGTYLWVASYSGDSLNNGATNACGAAGESVTVSAAGGTGGPGAKPAGH